MMFRSFLRYLALWLLCNGLALGWCGDQVTSEMRRLDMRGIIADIKACPFFENIPARRRARPGDIRRICEDTMLCTLDGALDASRLSYRELQALLAKAERLPTMLE